MPCTCGGRSAHSACRSIAEWGHEMPGRGRASVNDMVRVETAILLRVLRDEKSEDGSSHLSGSELAQAIGVSEFRTRSAVARLVQGGDLVSTPCFKSDGGQAANALAITDAGKARLDRLFSPR